MRISKGKRAHLLNVLSALAAKQLAETERRTLIERLRRERAFWSR